MTITITARHIQEGRKRGALSCPIALALNEATSAAWVVGVNCCFIMLDAENYDLPEKAQVFLRRFDRGQKVEPFTFDMEI